MEWILCDQRNLGNLRVEEIILKLLSQQWKKKTEQVGERYNVEN